MTKKILLLSAYDAESHKRWREAIVSQFTDVTWTQLVLPPRHFSWRIRGNSMIWAVAEKGTLDQHFDLILATSMVDLSSLIGMAPSLAGIPSVLYFHENQFAYPSSTRQNKSIEPSMVNLYSALSASYLKFNSRYNLESFLSGVADLLKRFPDSVPQGIVAGLRNKSAVLPVPIEDECFSRYIAPKVSNGFEPSKNATISNLEKKLLSSPANKKSVLDIVWNHRWEYDKGPDRLLALVRGLPQNLPLRFHVVGQSFRKSPKVFDEIHQLLADRNALGTWGYIHSLADYRSLLRGSDVVLSTAIHDFQGLSVIEATALGCMPLVPDRLAYKELFPSLYRYESDYNNEQLEHNIDFSRETQACLLSIQSLCSVLSTDDQSNDWLRSFPDLRDLSWSALRPAYQAVLE